jgi:hypothetical protein
MTLTKNLAKFMGLSVLLVAIGMISNKSAAVQTMNALFSDAPLMWITGVFTMMLGVAIVVAHNRWSGGALPVLVTLYGWIALLKGLSFVWLPPPTQAQLYQAMHFEQYFYAWLLVPLILGGYLVYSGFKPERTA